jgi:hypothetical protein
MIGYQWFVHENLPWRFHHGAVIPLFMPHVNVHFSEKELEALRQKSAAFFIRFDTNFDHPKKSEWWHVIKDSEFTLESYSSNTRSKIRRGLKSLISVKLSREDVISEGYQVYRSAYDRYVTFEQMCSKPQFEIAVKLMPPETEFMGVRCRESWELLAFSENIVRDNACLFNTIWFNPKGLKRYSSYVLIYDMCRYYLGDMKFRYVSDGSRNLSHATNIHQFLEGTFLFRKSYSTMQLVYAPSVRFALSCLYPLRSLFRFEGSNFVKKIRLLLRQHEIFESQGKNALSRVITSL